MTLADLPLPPGLSCRVEMQRVGGSVQLQGRVESERPLAGVYRLDIVKGGRSGSSSISQSGSFSARPGQAAEGGYASLDFAPGTTLVARLTLEADGKRFACPPLVASHD